MSPYDERELRELELLSVARLVGLAPRTPAAATPPAQARVSVERDRATSLAEPAPEPAPRELSAPVPPPQVATLDWQALRETVRDCQRCRLGESRRQAVLGVGSERGPWMFVGEGPGAEEDAQGEPFVGQAGKLLDGMLAALRLSRERDVYIANVVKCRPPGNRTPAPDEAAACADYLDRQIALVQPRLIVALGKSAALRLTGEEASLASQRGRRFTYRGAPLVVTYHPAYLLRNLPDKAKAWEDLLFARRVFDEVSADVKAANPST